MKRILILFFGSLMLFVNCKSSNQNQIEERESLDKLTQVDFTIAFGSCNKQNAENILWDPILLNNPKIWIWGGDIIYADTRDMSKLKLEYDKQRNNSGYKKLIESTKVIGTWDDHDYGLNDGGLEFDKKEESQQVFLDFMGISKTDERRQRKGVYASESIVNEQGSIKIIVLDTRYFRSALVEDTKTKKRYRPNSDKNATVLGSAQWDWLTEELNSSEADFNIIVSSIQFLSHEHGFETWGNFPFEVEKLKSTIVKSKAKGVLLLSGDRHISEFSKISIDHLDYPLIDFTSSGLTHSYSGFSGEPNTYRVGEVVSKISFGLLKFNFRNKSITMEMRGINNEKLQELTQQY
jgi:alkaline phosphatase D